MVKRDYQPLTIPKLEWDKKTLSSTYGQLIAGPLEPGFGITIGNALRRILLGGIEGAAVTHVIIKGVNNEFSALPGVEEDTMQVLLNCKNIRIRNKTGVSGSMRLQVSGAAEATVGDIVADSHLELVNTDFVLAHVAKGGMLDIEFFVEPGRGYRVAKWPIDKALQEDNRIYLDALFSPIKRVSLDVVKTRVGEDIDYDKMILTIETDGSETPVSVLHYAVSVLRTQLEHFLVMVEIPFNDISQCEVLQAEKEVVAPVSTSANQGKFDLLKSPIEALELSVRAHNCLKNAEIKRIVDLVRMDEDNVMRIKNFGRKSFDEVKARIAVLGLTFGMKINDEDL